MKKVMNASKKYVITIVSFAIILVACIGATIGITLAYFGDVKDASANITLGASIAFDGTGGIAVAAGSTTAVPSQTVDVTTTLKIVKGATGAVTKGVLQVTPAFSAGSTGATCTFTNGTKFNVTGVSNAVMIAQDNKLYLVNSSTTTNLVEIDPSSTVTISFTVPVAIPSTIGNSAGGQSCSLSMTAKVLQSNIYTDGTTTVAKTVSGFASYFDAFTAAA